MTKSLDLGCGANPRNPFNSDETYGIDVRDDLDKNIRKADLVVEPIPFADGEFDFVTAHDFLEHIPRLIYCPQRRYPFVELMNEIHRVLKVGGTFYSKTPVYPHGPTFRDPTHVNFITDETFPLYFDDVNRWAAMYGYNGSLKMVEQYSQGFYLFTRMQKVYRSGTM